MGRRRTIRPIYIHQGYVFRFIKRLERDGTELLYCSERTTTIGCFASAKRHPDNRIVLIKEHRGHAPNEGLARSKVARHHMKWAATQSLETTPQELIRQAADVYGEDTLEMAGSEKALRRMVERARVDDMSARTRRAAAVSANEKIGGKKWEQKIDSDDPEEHEEEEDDAPPPILEREQSCGENDDTDGDNGKEEESEEVTAKKETNEEEAEGKKCVNLLEALSHVFSADGPSSSSPGDLSGRKMVKKRQISSPDVIALDGPSRQGAMPKSQLLNKAPHRLTNFRPLNGTLNSTRKYGMPPPIPRGLRAPTVGVGSNTSLGPLKLLETRKRQREMEQQEFQMKRASLVAYNGGRAGENFRQIPSTSNKSPPSGTSSSASSGALIDVQTMLREQSPVRIQVSAGGNEEDSLIQDAVDFAIQQKETLGNVAKNASNHSILLSSMILNGLNTLQERDQEEYNQFSGELFALITKYRIN